MTSIGICLIFPNTLLVMVQEKAKRRGSLMYWDLLDSCSFCGITLPTIPCFLMRENNLLKLVWLLWHRYFHECYCCWSCMASTKDLLCFPHLPHSGLICSCRSLVIHKNISVVNGRLIPLNSPEESQSYLLRLEEMSSSWRSYCAFWISCRVAPGSAPVKFNTVIRAMEATDRITCFTIYKESIAIYFPCFRPGTRISIQHCHPHHSWEGTGLLIKYCENWSFWLCFILHLGGFSGGNMLHKQKVSPDTQSASPYYIPWYF